MNASAAVPTSNISENQLISTSSDAIGVGEFGELLGHAGNVLKGVQWPLIPSADIEACPTESQIRPQSTAIEVGTGATCHSTPAQSTSSAQTRRIQRYIMAESALRSQFAQVSSNESSARELQITALRQATLLLSSYADNSREHANRLHQLVKDSNGELNVEAYRNFKKQRWLEERRQAQLQLDKQVASDQLKSLSDQPAGLCYSYGDGVSLADTRRQSINLLKYFAATDYVTRVPISRAKRACPYSPNVALPSKRRKHAASQYPIPLVTASAVSQRAQEQGRFDSSASQSNNESYEPGDELRRRRKPTLLVLGKPWEDDDLDPPMDTEAISLGSSPSQLSLATLSDSTHPTPITGDPVMSTHHVYTQPSLDIEKDPSGLVMDAAESLEEGRYNYGTATIYSPRSSSLEDAVRSEVEQAPVQLPGYAITLMNELDEIHESFTFKPFSQRTIRSSHAQAHLRSNSQPVNKTVPAVSVTAPDGKDGKKRKAKALSTILEGPIRGALHEKFTPSTSKDTSPMGSGRVTPARSIASIRDAFLLAGKDEKTDGGKGGVGSKLKKRFSGLFRG